MYTADITDKYCKFHVTKFSLGMIRIKQSRQTSINNNWRKNSYWFAGSWLGLIFSKTNKLESTTFPRGWGSTSFSLSGITVACTEHMCESTHVNREKMFIDHNAELSVHKHIWSVLRTSFYYLHRLYSMAETSQQDWLLLSNEQS